MPKSPSRRSDSDLFWISPASKCERNTRICKFRGSSTLCHRCRGVSGCDHGQLGPGRKFGHGTPCGGPPAVFGAAAPSPSPTPRGAGPPPADRRGRARRAADLSGPRRRRRSSAARPPRRIGASVPAGRPVGPGLARGCGAAATRGRRATARAGPGGRDVFGSHVASCDLKRDPSFFQILSAGSSSHCYSLMLPRNSFAANMATTVRQDHLAQCRDVRSSLIQYGK